MTTVEWTSCYCGGWVRSLFTRDKRLHFGWRRDHYKKHRWQIDNCYPRLWL
jgi:hypothetical protein